MRSRGLRGAFTTFATTFFLAALVAGGGCEAVPDLQFVGEETGADARVDAAQEATPGDSSVDGATRDGSPGACTGAPPGAGATCCGTVWCEGDCTQPNCDACAAKAAGGGCVADDVCCGKTGTVLCKKQCP